MKNKIILILLVHLYLINCYVGTKETACKYYLERDFGNYCDALLLSQVVVNTDQINPGQAIGINISLVGCLTYLKKKKDCEREENKYLPGLYGYIPYNKEHFELCRNSELGQRTILRPLRFEKI